MGDASSIGENDVFPMVIAGPDPFPSEDVFRTRDAALDDRFRRLAGVLLGETEEKMKEKVRELRNRIKDEDIQVPDSDHLYRKLLRAGELDVETSLLVLRNYLRAFSVSPRCFDHVLPFTASKKVFRAKMHSVLPKRDKYGRRVYIFRAGAWNPDKISYSELYSTSFKIAEVMAMEPKTQVAGCTIIVDGRGYGLKQFTGMTIADVKLMMFSMEKGFPLWFRAVHVIHTPKMLKIMHGLAMPFLSARTRESVLLHSSLEELHKHVDPEILPEEYGGTQGPFDNSEIHEATERFEDYFRELLSCQERYNAKRK